MIHLKHYITALKVTWIRRIFNKLGNWGIVMETYFNKDMLSIVGSEKNKTTVK